MSAVVSLSGRTFALTIPKAIGTLLYPQFKPFTITERDEFDASFIVEYTEDAISFDNAEPRGNIFFREDTPSSFSLFDSRFRLHVFLDEKRARLFLGPFLDDAGAIIFSSLKWFMSFIVLHEGGLPMHSSLIAYEGSGMLFCGPSERGKSTISSLLASGLPSALRGSDEVNCIFPAATSLSVYSTPYKSSGDIGSITARLPLKKIFFLEQAENNRVEYITTGQVFRHLLRNVYHIAGNKLLMDRMMATMEQISTAGIYNVLYFKNDLSIADFLKQTSGYDHAPATQC